MEALRWFLVVVKTKNTSVVTGMCSDGRTFTEPTASPDEWVKGFTTHCNMSGQEFEIREGV